MFITSRSQMEDFSACPRKGFLRYKQHGTGVVPERRNIPAMVGAGVHDGIGAALDIARLREPEGFSGVELVPVARLISCVGFALERYDKMIRENGLQLFKIDDEFYAVKEQRALIEALLWMWFRSRLPAFLQKYEVLEVEREDSVLLTAGIRMNARADALLRDRQHGDLYILSIKTAGKWSEWKEEEARHDMQGITELWATEQRRGERVRGIQMEYLLRGDRNKRTDYLQDSPLIRPWSFEVPSVVGESEYRYAYEQWYRCTEPHKFGKSNRKCPGDANHRLGDDWQRVNIWERMPVKEWIESIPDEELEKYWVSPQPFYRNDEQVESWFRQARAEEFRNAVHAEQIGTNPTIESLDEFFPQRRHQCLRFGEMYKCPYFDYCWGPLRGRDLRDHGFVERVDHHSVED